MGGTLNFGAVLSWKSFEFDDGGTSNKLLIVLGAKQGQNLIAVLLTSQQHRRKSTAGCHARDGYYFIPVGAWGFAKDTWVELNRPVEMIYGRVIKAAMVDKELRVLRNLDPQWARELRNCLKQSPDLTAHQQSLLE